MSVDNPEKVDFIGVDKKTGEVVLAISDHLEWADTDNHLIILQDKINAYLSFIENGEIYDSYPNAVGKKISIQITAQHHFPPDALDFIEKAKTFLSTIDIGLRLIEEPNA